MGFTTALRIQRKDLRQGARLAWQELDMYREAFRSVGVWSGWCFSPPPPCPVGEWGCMCVEHGCRVCKHEGSMLRCEG